METTNPITLSAGSCIPSAFRAFDITQIVNFMLGAPGLIREIIILDVLQNVELSRVVNSYNKLNVDESINPGVIHDMMLIYIKISFPGMQITPGDIKYAYKQLFPAFCRLQLKYPAFTYYDEFSNLSYTVYHGRNDPCLDCVYVTNFTFPEKYEVAPCSEINVVNGKLEYGKIGSIIHIPPGVMSNKQKIKVPVCGLLTPAYGRGYNTIENHIKSMPTRWPPGYVLPENVWIYNYYYINNIWYSPGGSYIGKYYIIDDIKYVLHNVTDKN